MKLYHLSERNLDGQVLEPRVPRETNRLDGEDEVTPRVCLAPSVHYCLLAIGNIEDYYYVHEVANHPIIKTNKKIIKEKRVPDATATKEIWALTPVELKCVAKIKLDKSKHLLTTKFFDCVFKFYDQQGRYRYRTVKKYA